MKRIDFTVMPKGTGRWNWLSEQDITSFIAIYEHADPEIHDDGCPWEARTQGCGCCSYTEDLSDEKAFVNLQYMIYHKTIELARLNVTMMELERKINDSA